MKASSADAATPADSVRLVLSMVAWSSRVALLTGSSCEATSSPSGPAESQGPSAPSAGLKRQSSPEQLTQKDAQRTYKQQAIWECFVSTVQACQPLVAQQNTKTSAACGALSDTHLKQQVTAQVCLHVHSQCPAIQTGTGLVCPICKSPANVRCVCAHRHPDKQYGRLHPVMQAASAPPVTVQPMSPAPALSGTLMGSVGRSQARGLYSTTWKAWPRPDREMEASQMLAFSNLHCCGPGILPDTCSHPGQAEPSAVPLDWCAASAEQVHCHHTTVSVSSH